VDRAAGDVTVLLRAWRAGDEDAYRRVSGILYDELRRLARNYVRRKRSGEALEATSLVHEAFMRLASARQVDWQDRRHFLAVAARTMRRVLVDAARARAAVKRGSHAAHIPVPSDLAGIGTSPVDAIALDEALERLGAFDARKVHVVELRFFAGLTVPETAQVLQVAPDTVARDWRMARAWLRRELQGVPKV
jgi:RNA polymerase sigma factor (TIGR02999 family)